VALMHSRRINRLFRCGLFNQVFRSSNCIASNGKIIIDNALDRMRMEVVVVVLYQHFLGMDEGNHETTYLFHRSRLEPGTSQVQIKIVTI
jgi:hypothetical protein